MGCLADTIEAAKKAGASVLLALLKRTFRIEINDVNFMERARSEQQKDLEGHIKTAMSMQEKQAKTICQLKKGWDQFLGDMETVQEVCEHICGTGLAVLPAHHASFAETEIMTMLWHVSEWSEQKIYESIGNLKETIKQGK